LLPPARLDRKEVDMTDNPFAGDKLAEKSPFRQAALARLNTPEQLDRLLTVTPPRSWIALIVLAALIGVALAWAFLGQLSTYETARGLFRNEGGRVVEALAPGQGTLTEILAVRGDLVKKGQVVARIVSTAAEQQIANARDAVTERRSELRRQREVADTEYSSKHANYEDRRAALGLQADAAKSRIETLKSMLADQEKLLAAKIMVRATVLQTQSQLDQAQREVDEATSQLAQIDHQELDQKIQADQRIKTAEFNLADASRKLLELVEENRVSGEVIAPADGVVNEVQSNLGTVVSRSKNILSIETSRGHGLEFIAFVPITGADKIKPGQPVRITPNAATREEEGTMLGAVREIGHTAASTEALHALLQSDDLVRSFTSQGPVILAYLDLDEDPNTVSGYAWTSSRGADEPVSAGNFGSADVEVRSDRPIGLLIPTLRRWSGVID
jgi:HlyD family secretion protein